MSNPFTRRGKEPNYTTENFSVRDVKAANARFYEKNPDAIEPAAMIKKAMQDPDDEVWLRTMGHPPLSAVASVLPTVHSTCI